MKGCHLGPGPGPFGPIGPGSRPIWAHWARVPAHLGPLGLGPGPFGPIGPGSRPIWTHLGLGPGPFGPGSWPIWAHLDFLHF